MTYKEILESPKLFLTPAEIAPVLHCTPYSINVQAQADQTKLGYPVVVQGRRVRIPRKAFIRFVEGENRDMQ